MRVLCKAIYKAERGHVHSPSFSEGDATCNQIAYARTCNRFVRRFVRTCISTSLGEANICLTHRSPIARTCAPVVPFGCTYVHKNRSHLAPSFRTNLRFVRRVARTCMTGAHVLGFRTNRRFVRRGRKHNRLRTNRRFVTPSFPEGDATYTDEICAHRRC